MLQVTDLFSENFQPNNKKQTFKKSVKRSFDKRENSKETVIKFSENKRVKMNITETNETYPNNIRFEHKEVEEDFKYIAEEIYINRKKCKDFIKNEISKGYSEEIKDILQNLSSHQTDHECPCQSKNKIYKDNTTATLKTSTIKNLLQLSNSIITECLCSNQPITKKLNKQLKFNLSIKKTRSCGFGLFTNETIKKGEYVGPYVGEVKILDLNKIGSFVPMNRLKTTLFGYERDGYDMDQLDADSGVSASEDVKPTNTKSTKNTKESSNLFKDSYYFEGNPTPSLSTNHLVIDSYHKGNATRFINHSCDPNLLVTYVVSDLNKIPTIAFFALRNIEINEQLTFDYTECYWKTKNDQNLFCACGSGEKCRFSERAYRMRQKIIKKQQSEEHKRIKNYFL